MSGTLSLSNSIRIVTPSEKEIRITIHTCPP
jgi:hypothetical protein